jgi:hypothetical protein
VELDATDVKLKIARAEEKMKAHAEEMRKAHAEKKMKARAEKMKIAHAEEVEIAPAEEVEIAHAEEMRKAYAEKMMRKAYAEKMMKAPAEKMMRAHAEKMMKVRDALIRILGFDVWWDSKNNELRQNIPPNELLRKMELALYALKEVFFKVCGFPLRKAPAVGKQRDEYWRAKLRRLLEEGKTLRHLSLKEMEACQKMQSSKIMQACIRNGKQNLISDIKKGNWIRISKCVLGLESIEESVEGVSGATPWGDKDASEVLRKIFGWYLLNTDLFALGDQKVDQDIIDKAWASIGGEIIRICGHDTRYEIEPTEFVLDQLFYEIFGVPFYAIQDLSKKTVKLLSDKYAKYDEDQEKYNKDQKQLNENLEPWGGNLVLILSEGLLKGKDFWKKKDA